MRQVINLPHRFRNGLIFLHRWLGVMFCALFAMWFTSGFVMMYWTFPRIDSADRLARSEALEASRIQLSPEQAFARVKDRQIPNRVVITMLDGRPVYRFFAEGTQNVVFGDNGDLLTDVPEGMARRIAAAWTRRPVSDARFEGTMREADQWTVSGSFRAHRPLLKFAWPDGQEVYVSSSTAEVVQHSTRGSRLGAYFGAIPHWLYFAPLRRNGKLWSRIVIWSSGAGTVVGLLGLIVGSWMYSPFKRYRTREGFASFPYTGQKRWHAILGLVFGPFACTWVLSGMMSMDPFPGMAQSGAISLREAQVLISAFTAKHPREALAELNAKELELVSIAGAPFYLAIESPGLSRVVPTHGDPQPEFEEQRLVAVLAEASRPHQVEEVRRITEYESYYVDRHNRLPLPALFIRINDRGHSVYYVDPKTARITESYNASSRWNRWIYHGLHSMDLPWLYRHRPVWDIVVLTLLSGGSALCFTALVIGWRVLRAVMAS